MKVRYGSLRALGLALVLSAFAAGLGAAVVWARSEARWTAHQTEAYLAGVTVYAALQNATAPPAGVTISRVSAGDQAAAALGQFTRVSTAPRAARLTSVPILSDAANRVTGAPLFLALLSPDLVYPLAHLPRREGQTAAETTGEVFRLLSTYCSDVVVLAQMGSAPWVRIAAPGLWSCDAAPPDHRLLAVILALVGLAAAGTVILNTTESFSRFARDLEAHDRRSGAAAFDTEGPVELREIVAAVNTHLDAQRAQIENRAEVLSGVSHDLGTPATRLRLRTALIPDAELREKLEADIDSMTGMIESVLTYTRAEMNAETPRDLALGSLLEALVDDYRDMGAAVTLARPRERRVAGGRSVFGSRQGHGVLPAPGEVVVRARPIALKRAISNLIDNALKYGRRAEVRLEADADTASIIVQDEGKDTTAEEVEALIAPFRRGGNIGSVKGYGMGLTIAATIAQQHGGALRFATATEGLMAQLIIRRV